MPIHGRKYWRNHYDSFVQPVLPSVVRQRSGSDVSRLSVGMMNPFIPKKKKNVFSILSHSARSIRLFTSQTLSTTLAIHEVHVKTLLLSAWENSASFSSLTTGPDSSTKRQVWNVLRCFIHALVRKCRRHFESTWKRLNFKKYYILCYDL